MENIADDLELLGLSSSCLPTMKDLRKAFKKKSILLLPEKHPTTPNAHSRFEDVNTAFIKVI